MRSLKIALFACVWLACLSSCATAKRCAKKYPPLPADTVIVVKTEWHDTTIYLTTPADTLRDTVEITLPCPEADQYVSQIARVENELASAKAWIENKRLRLELQIKERQLAIHIDSVAELRKEIVTVTTTKIVKEKFVPPFYRASLFVNIALMGLFIIGIFLSLRR